MEEGGVVEGTDKTHRWHVDPLDGTTNFLHGIPHFCISVGLEREGVPVAGVIYDPAQGRDVHRREGQGRLPQQPPPARRRRGATWPMRWSSAACRISAAPAIRTFLAELAAVMAVAAGLRRMGAAALDLAYVAAGRADAYWERDLKTWDMAAGIVLVREAGGFVSDARRRRDAARHRLGRLRQRGAAPALLGAAARRRAPATPAA